MAKKIYYNECLLCGDKYPYCGHCNDDRYDAWRDVACCWSHYAYLKPIIEYQRKEISKDGAKKTLEDVSAVYGKVKMEDFIRKTFNEIMAEPKTEKKAKKPVKAEDEI